MPGGEHKIRPVSAARRRALTGYLAHAHEAADEGGLGEEQVEHPAGAHVEDLVEVQATLLLRQANSLLGWGRTGSGF